MASKYIDEITAQCSMLQSLSVSNIEDSLEQKIYCTQAIQAQIATEMSKLQEEPTQQANQVANLQEKDQELAKIMEEEKANWKQVSVLSCMYLQQVEEVKAQSREILCLSALVEKQQEAIEHFVVLKVLGNWRQHQLAPNPGWT